MDIYKVANYSEEILELIDNKDDFTRGDLQGTVGALVMKIMEER